MMTNSLENRPYNPLNGCALDAARPTSTSSQVNDALTVAAAKWVAAKADARAAKKAIKQAAAQLMAAMAGRKDARTADGKRVRIVTMHRRAYDAHYPATTFETINVK